MANIVSEELEYDEEGEEEMEEELEENDEDQVAEVEDKDNAP